MKQLNLPNNQHKTITTRKIMKLRKIKKITKRKTKRKTKIPKAPNANSDHGIKREKKKIKKNETDSVLNKIQQIKQRVISLRDKINILMNGSENQTNNGTNMHSYNINDSNGNESNPQNRNTNNYTQNSMHFHLHIPLNDSDDYSFRFSRSRERANQEVIKEIKKKLTKIRFNESVLSNGNNGSCNICYEVFKNNQNVYSLPCHHLFHIHCLNKEINYRQKCPICRNEL